GPEGIEVDGFEAAYTPRGGGNRDVVTIRKIESCPPRGYVDGPQTWASGGRRVQRRRGGEAGSGVAVDEAAIAGRQRRQRGTVDLRLVVGGDRQRRRRDVDLDGCRNDVVVGRVR